MNAGENAPHGITLDTLFRRAGVRNAHALALADPPNRAAFTGGAPRRLTFAQADRAVSAFAAHLRMIGLHTDTVVGLQLPNTVESVIAILGTVRAGMVAAPLPLLWRRREMIEALGRAGAKAIVTAGRIGACAHAEIAMEVAAELFPIRQICGFGDNLPDGVVPLDDVFAAAGSEPPSPRLGDAAAHVAACTFAHGADGAVAVPHNHAHLIAAGAALLREAGLGADAPILSTIPATSLAGLSLTLMPWLMTGGTLHLHHGFADDAFAAQAAGLAAGAVVLPGPTLPALAHRIAPSNRIVALWRGPLGADAGATVANAVDAFCVDETTLIAARRGDDGLADATIVEAAARLVAPGSIGVGAYRFSQRALDAVTAAVDPAAMIAALPDAMLGQRLAGRTSDAGRMAAELAARGVNPLVAGAFRGRAQPLPSS